LRRLLPTSPIFRSRSQPISADATLNINQIGQIAIPIQDLDRAVTFYRDVLELPLLFQAPPGLAFFHCGAVRLMLSRPTGVESSAVGVIYYQVPDVHHAYATLQARSVDLIDEPHLIAKLPDHELWMFFLRDSEGNMLAMMSEVRG
jgi:methylmalonyl-CoA/ethylmalonyl-CoA epimerase